MGGWITSPQIQRSSANLPVASLFWIFAKKMMLGYIWYICFYLRALLGHAWDNVAPFCRGVWWELSSWLIPRLELKWDLRNFVRGGHAAEWRRGTISIGHEETLIYHILVYYRIMFTKGIRTVYSLQPTCEKKISTYYSYNSTLLLLVSSTTARRTSRLDSDVLSVSPSSIQLSSCAD